MRLRNGKNIDDTEENTEEQEKPGLTTPLKDNTENNFADMSNANMNISRSRLNHVIPREMASNGSDSVDSVPSKTLISQAVSAAGIAAAAVNTNGNNASVEPSVGNTIAEDARPHDKNMLFVLKCSGSLLFIMYFIVPAIVKFNPWIMSELIFLHRIRIPFFANLEKPVELGVNGTMNFRIQTTNDLTLGAWHILPENLHDQNVGSSREFSQLLHNNQEVIIYLHGNAGTRATPHRRELYMVLSKAGFHVIAVDYRGYGDSEGSPTEQGLVDDALAAFDWVKSRSGDSKVYFWGHSLGTGVATQAAKRACGRGTLPAGVILEAPFTNIVDAVISHPLSTPFRYMPYFTWVFIESLKYNNIYFSNDKHISHVTVPVLILHAKDDDIVPFHLGQKLYDVGRSKQTEGAVHFVSFEADHHYSHDNIYRAADLMQIVRDFITDRLRS